MNLNIRLPSGPAISRLGINPREMKVLCPQKEPYVNVLRSFTHNSPKLVQVIDRRMDEQRVVPHAIE